MPNLTSTAGLTVTDSTFTGNRANNHCSFYPTPGGGYAGLGGGVYNEHGRTLTIS